MVKHNCLVKPIKGLHYNAQKYLGKTEQIDCVCFLHGGLETAMYHITQLRLLGLYVNKEL